MKKYTLAFLFLLIFTSSSFARWVDYSKFLETDLDEKMPTLEELAEKYENIPDKHYYRKYEYHWNIGNVFDEAFRTSISGYGSTGKRLKHEDEESLMKSLSSMPIEHLQYVGPFLHTLPNMPEKVLNMPGIKETKNKFPTRIASQIKDMENLEFVSPYLYFMLMPEAWPDYKSPDEKPLIKRSMFIQSEYDPQFFENVAKKVPQDDYLLGANPKQSAKSQKRTRKPTKNAPLTSADVEAFANTLDGVMEFGRNNDNLIRISSVRYMLDDWEFEHGKALPVPFVKDNVNPCQRVLQRIRIAGLETDFALIVAKEGFDTKSWAYTCDKTIKAFRVANMNYSVLQTLINYQNNVYSSSIDALGDDGALGMYANMQSVLKMYQAPDEDIKEVKYNQKILHEKFTKMKGALIDSPLIILY